MAIRGLRVTRLAILLAAVIAVSAFEGCRRHYPPDPAHGVPMFDVDADLKPSMVKWLEARLAIDGPPVAR